MIAVHESLRRRYLIALILIAGSMVLGVMLSTATSDQQRMDASAINLAGRQRMLSQRIVKLAFEIRDSNGVERRRLATRMERQLETFVETQASLRFGSEQKGLPGDERLGLDGSFALVTQSAEDVEKSARGLLETVVVEDTDPHLGNAALVRLSEAERAYLPAMDSFVFTLEHEAVARVDEARRLNYVRLLVSFVVLILEALFIFQPAVREIRRYIHDLQHAESVIAERNQRLQAVNAKLEESLVQVLSGLHPICVGCKSIKGGDGEWVEVSEFLSRRTDATFSHGLCEPCAVKMYPELADEIRELTES